MQGTSIGIIGVVNSLCTMLMAYFVTFLKNIMGTDSSQDIFIIFAVLMAAVLVLSLIYKLKVKTPWEEKAKPSV